MTLRSRTRSISQNSMTDVERASLVGASSHGYNNNTRSSNSNLAFKNLMMGLGEKRHFCMLVVVFGFVFLVVESTLLNRLINGGSGSVDDVEKTVTLSEFGSGLCDPGTFSTSGIEHPWTFTEDLVKVAPGAGTATSGKVFKGKRVREFPTKSLKFQDKGLADKTKVDARLVEALKFNGPSCTHWSVTTTIFEPSDAMQIQANLNDDWCLVVAGDRKGRKDYRLKRSTDGSSSRIVYLNAKQQETLAAAGIDLIDKLPWNHFGRKNVGYLYAIANGAKYIWDFDDDNNLINRMSKTILTPCNDESQPASVVGVVQPVKNQCSSYNPYPVMGAPFAWPRGLPLQDIKDPMCVSKTPQYDLKYEQIAREKLVVCQSLAQHDPDVDAIYRLTRKIPFNFNGLRTPTVPIKVPEKAMTPFNAQATMFERKAFWMLLLPITVHGRVSDIWRSYFGQRLLRELGLEVLFVAPLVEQYRNVHEYIGDLESEQPLYTKSKALVEFLLQWEAPKELNFLGRIEALYVEMFERTFIEKEDVELMQTWLITLAKTGYEFPKLKMDALTSCESDWPDTALFLPGFPGGLPELRANFGRTAAFFWPRDRLKIQLVFDDNFEDKTKIAPTQTREKFARQLLSYFPKDAENIGLAYNPRISKRFGKGHDIQQLVMFWADNFTDAEYVGFIDDDALLSVSVRKQFLFDEQNRPRLIVLHEPTALPGSQFYDFWRQVGKKTKWALGQPEIFRGMNYFPFMMKRKHFRPLREFIMSIHGTTYRTFDDFFAKLQDWPYAQFNIMANYLWRFHRDEYSWHVESVDQKWAFGYPNGEAPEGHADGTPRDHGVTKEMLMPQPRIAHHANYGTRKGDPNLIEDTLRAGYCYSQPLDQPDKKRCGNFDILNQPNHYFQWCFEEHCIDWVPGYVDQHKFYMQTNCKRHWDHNELQKIF